MAVVFVGVAYAVVLAFGMVRHGFSDPITDPVLALMELLTIASAVPILLLFVALRATVTAGRRRLATRALGFASLFALATVGVHLFELTAGRRLGTRGLVWPSTSYAIELLAWDLLLGLALACAAGALRREERAERASRWLAVTGALCLAGTAGPLLGSMRVQLIGVFGYAVLLPVTAWMLSAWFGREWLERRAPQ
jgi:hypothetical protein